MEYLQEKVAERVADLKSEAEYRLKCFLEDPDLTGKQNVEEAMGAVLDFIAKIESLF